MDLSEALPSIIEASAEILAVSEDEGIIAVSSQLRRNYEYRVVQGCSDSRVLEILSAATARLEYPTLARILNRYGHLLPWIIKGGEFPPYVELVGPDEAPLICNEFRFGMYLQPPEFFYPPHNHAAEEYYYLLCGNVEWQKDDETFEAFSSPSVVHHEPWQRHAMRTTTDSLFALWVWLGDIRYSTYRIDPY